LPLQKVQNPAYRFAAAINTLSGKTGRVIFLSIELFFVNSRRILTFHNTQFVPVSASEGTFLKLFSNNMIFVVFAFLYN